MVDAWTTGGYKEAFIGNGSSAIAQETALKQVMAGMGVFIKSELANERMAVALLTPSEEDEHSCFSDNTHRDIDLNYKVQVSFEQEFHIVDGPSASLAKGLICLSSIGGVPLRQDLAITGTMNHKGIAGPIGGASHKIRGFFRACEDKGLTGTQGVIIPAPNVQHLMLNRNVIKAVEQGKFHIYSVETLQDAADKFMEKHGGFKAVDEKARKQLVEWSK